MRVLFLSLLTLIIGGCMAQPEKQDHNAIASKFERLYNAQQPDSIFALFSGDMKAALPLENTTAFFAGLYTQAGKINSRELRKFQGSYAIYKTRFERGVFSLHISLDN